MKALTKRQAEVMAFLLAFSAENGRMPRVREVLVHFGWTGTNNVVEHFRRLVAKGYLEHIRSARDGSNEYRLVAEAGHCRSCGQELPR